MSLSVIRFGIDCCSDGSGSISLVVIAEFGICIGGGFVLCWECDVTTLLNSDDSVAADVVFQSNSDRVDWFCVVLALCKISCIPDDVRNGIKI